MQLPISHATWQVLRTLIRSRKPLVGIDLRLTMTRQTKDGTFLTELVRIGLLELVDPVDGKPFESRYKLTEAGKHAAEYGDYECDTDRVAVAAQYGSKAAGTVTLAPSGPKKPKPKK